MSTNNPRSGPDSAPRRPPAPKLDERDASLAASREMGQPLANWDIRARQQDGRRALLYTVGAIATLLMIVPVHRATNDALIISHPTASTLVGIRAFFWIALAACVVLVVLSVFRFLRKRTENMIVYLFEGGLLYGRQHGALRPAPWSHASQLTLYSGPPGSSLEENLVGAFITIPGGVRDAPSITGIPVMPEILRETLQRDQEKLRLLEHVARQADLPVVNEVLETDVPEPEADAAPR